jgi:CheY-like chemotaxis protein
MKKQPGEDKMSSNGQAAMQKQAAFDPAKYRVLVVDDEPSVLLTYRLILEREGYDTTAAATAREAIDMLGKQDFHIILCDYSLEEKRTGFDVIEFARRKNPAAPCLLLTGYANSDTVTEAEKAGVGVLFKPIDIEEFLNTIPSKLKEAYASEAVNCKE